MNGLRFYFWRLINRLWDGSFKYMAVTRSEFISVQGFGVFGYNSQSREEF